ncbi:MAG TPA: arginine deiminase family protein [Candidatus Krumholzibacteria bacterium]|nr:arginine deiminase family protein [Candidatus Krumholzibacteria bacterium]
MSERFPVRVESEIGRLTGVVLHDPGQEVANMTPETAERALYSDILSLEVAGQEYAQLRGVLARRTRVFQVRELLADILADGDARAELVRNICRAEGVPAVAESLLDTSPSDLARLLIEGVPLVKDNLTRFLSPDRYSLPPLHNFFFTRDGAVTVGDTVHVSCMASPVRGRESRIMEAIFDHHPVLGAPTVNPARLADDTAGLTIEGGDVLVAAPEVLVVGIGARTTPKAIDFLIERCRRQGLRRHILVQELPRTPESFIHLDMVFTLLDRNLCLVYEPVVMETHHFDVVHIHVEGGEVRAIREEDTLLTGLAKLGLELEPVFCGGRDDRWLQEREQWHSGANVFALAPGQVIGYGRNAHTVDELAKAGFAVIAAEDVIDGTADLDTVGRCLVTIDGSELARGGGGCRCMTMPVGREPLS